MKSNDPNSRTRLLVLTSTLPGQPGNGEPGFVLELATRLSEYFDITILAPHAPGLNYEESWNDVTVRRFRYAPASLETLTHQGGIQAQLHAHPWKHLLVPLFLLAEWRYSRKLLRTGHFDVVHAHWLFPQGLIALASGEKPVIVTAHGSDLHSLHGWLFRLIQRHVLKHSRIVAVVSAAMAKMAQAIGGPIRDLRILPMGVDLQSRFTPIDIAREAATFLFVGRLVACKGLDVLLEALSLLQREIPDARLVIIGSGPEKSNYRAQAHALGIADRVEFTGALPNAQLPVWYRRATALVGPSRAEGLGLTFIEAAGCACPIIATDLPAVREILAHEESGLLLPPNAPEQLARAMHRLATDRATASGLGNRARAGVLARYDWSITSTAYAAAIEDIVASEP